MAPPQPFDMSTPITKVIVTGDREWTDYDAIEEQMKALVGLYGRSLMVLNNGHAGAESLAMKAAHALGLASHAYPPDYLNHGKPALARAQQVMLESNPGIIRALVFEDKATRPSLMLMRRCTALGIPWHVFRKEIVIRG